MTLNITSKQMDITAAIRSHIEERFKKLDKWRAQLINPHVILSKAPDGFMAEATISTQHSNLFATAKHDDMYTAVNDLIAKLERQLDKSQHKDEARRAHQSLKNLPQLDTEA